MRRVAPFVIAAVLLLAGCTSAPPPEPHARDSHAPDSVAETDWDAGLGLVNLWRVSGAENTGPDTFVRFAESEVTVWADCGVSSGAWRALGTSFIADLWGSNSTQCLGDLAKKPAASLEWLFAAQGFRAVGEGVELLDRDGAVVAVLAVDGAPNATPNFADSYLVAPEITPKVRAFFENPQPLSEGVTPVDASTLVGRWQFAGDFSGETPFVEFSDDGWWEGSDGCNSSSGRWAADGAGAFVATNGISTLMFCEGAAVSAWVWAAARAGIRDSQLVLFDSAGAELGVLEAT